MFYSKDGIYFERKEDGSVTIYEVEEYGYKRIIITLLPNEWASLVAQMCKDGETDITFYRSLYHHAGEMQPGYKFIDMYVDMYDHELKD